jgi:hypothetical protein
MFRGGFPVPFTYPHHSGRCGCGCVCCWGWKTQGLTHAKQALYPSPMLFFFFLNRREPPAHAPF